MEIAENFRKRDIPCDTIYLDIDYMDGYRVFTWNNERFKAPSHMINRLKKSTYFFFYFCWKLKNKAQFLITSESK